MLAVYHGVRPPTLHCDDPHPLLAATRFRTLAAAEPWEGGTRRAAVNAFGFGGINAHVIVDAPETRTTRTTRTTRAARAARSSRSAVAPALVLAASSQAALLDALQSGRSEGGGLWRLAIFEPTPAKLAVAQAAIEAGRPRHGRDGIHFSPAGLVAGGGKVAFLFPGVEANFAPQVDDIAAHFGLPAPNVDAPDLEHQGIHVFTLNSFLERVTGRLGLRPDMLAGHSIGEWSGMMASGILEEKSLRDFLGALEFGTLRVAQVSYVAVGAGAQRLVPLLADLDGVVVSHDNCIHQSIVCGPPAPIEVFAQRLRERRILHEVLPFRSGFHSPALAAYLPHYGRLLDELTLAPAAVPLWSATTCAPYPADPAQIRALFLDHLVQPVHFRELVLALYAAGARVFVQVGTGSLGAFVDDVLAGLPHHAVSLTAPNHPGMEQLRRACAALYVEGVPIDLATLDPGDSRPGTGPRDAMHLELGAPLIRVSPLHLQASPQHLTAAPVNGDPVMAAFDAGMRELAAAQQDVLRAFASPRPVPRAPAAPAPAPVNGERTDHIEFSLATFPELIDHCLLPQPKHWPAAIDRGPAVPMTMSVALLMESAQRLDPRTPVAVTDVLASAWLYVEPPVGADIVCKRLDADRIHVKIGAFFEGTVTMAEHYPSPPPPAIVELEAAREFPVPMDEIYPEGWLFHGPQYQGVVAVRDFAKNGVRGTLRALPAKGALLDAAGQLYGLWVVATAETDRLAMPVRMTRVDFYGSDPAPGELVDCTVRVRHFGRREVRADLELVQGNRVYARITGWEDWRFETGGGIYELIRQPAHNLLATIDAHGIAMIEDPGWRSVTVESLSRRYLSTREREGFGGIRRLQRQRDWLYGRIAAKDAVRDFLRQRGGDPLFPIEIAIESDATGQPRVKGPFARDIRVSIAHKDSIACAIASEGFDRGIDIEKIEPRSDAFAALAFTADELRLLPGTDRDEWRTRGWSAKEAAGKARGTGLQGNPKGLRLTAVDQDRLLVDGRWIATRRHGNYIIAWTVQ